MLELVPALSVLTFLLVIALSVANIVLLSRSKQAELQIETLSQRLELWAFQKHGTTPQIRMMRASEPLPNKKADSEPSAPRKPLDEKGLKELALKLHGSY